MEIYDVSVVIWCCGVVIVVVKIFRLFALAMVQLGLIFELYCDYRAVFISEATGLFENSITYNQRIFK